MPAKHGTSRPRSSGVRISRLAISAVLVDFAHAATLESRRPSCPNHPEKASLVRPRAQSRGLLRQVPQSGRGLCRYKCSNMPISRFVQLSVMPPRSRLFKSGGPRDRCNTNLGPNLRPVNSKAASFLYKCAQNCQKGVMCVRAESTIRVKAL